MDWETQKSWKKDWGTQETWKKGFGDIKPGKGIERHKKTWEKVIWDALKDTKIVEKGIWRH